MADVRTMEVRDEPRLSLSEWVVLCLVGEQPTHGLAVAALLARDSALGQIWYVPAPIAAVLSDRLHSATGFERTLALWRSESISATLRFLEAASSSR